MSTNMQAGGRSIIGPRSRRRSSPFSWADDDDHLRQRRRPLRLQQQHPLGAGSHRLPLRLAGVAGRLLCGQDRHISASMSSSSAVAGGRSQGRGPDRRGSACLPSAVLLLKGSWDYWYPFVTKRAFLRNQRRADAGLSAVLRRLAERGRAATRSCRASFPTRSALGMALFTCASCRPPGRILHAARADALLIAGHEAEEMLEEAASQSDGETGRGRG